MYRRQNAALEKGYTIISGTTQGLSARCTVNVRRLVVRSVLPSGEEHTCDLPMEEEVLLSEAQKGGFFSYAAGVACQFLKNWHVGGLEIDNYRTDLPVKKGLSSSAAFCVLVARAFNRLYDLNLTVQGEMELAYRGEITTPSRCGRMDQGCAYGNRPILMMFDQDLVQVDEITPGGTFSLLIVDLKGRKDTIRILADLNRSYPFAREDRDREVQKYLGEINRDIVERSRRAIETGDAEALGALMTEAQEQFDRHLAPSSPGELEAPLLHRLLSHPPLQKYIHGGKGVGSQGDGTAQLVCAGADARSSAASLIERELGMDCLPLDIAPARPLRSVLIPAAGFGSELFPASKVVQKELFPVVDPAGIAKPVILTSIEQAEAAGFEKIVVVIKPGDRRQLASFFEDALSPQKGHRLSPELKEYNKRITALRRKLEFVEQESPLGFGHAVFCARERLSNEPFVLMLGDYLYVSPAGTPSSCIEQLAAVYRKHQRTVVGVKVIAEKDLAAYGVVAGDWIREPGRGEGPGAGGLLEVREIAEKPTSSYARSTLRTEGLPEGRYLGLFGIYVLQEEIFHFLDSMIKHNLDVSGQFELTTALEALRKEKGCLASVVQGESYDMGFPDHYLSALQAFRRPGGTKNDHKGEANGDKKRN